MNYNLVVDTSNFKPFDYGLALHMLQNYNTGYEKQQAVYDKIAQTLGDLASAVEGTTRAKQIYDDYNSRFNAAAEDFSRGMTTINSRELGNLRKIYGTQIRQLERANEAMVKEAERRRTEKDPSMMYQSIGTLDNYLDDPNRTLGRYSGTQLTNDVASIAKAVGNSIIQKANNGQLDKYTKLWIQTKGFSQEDVTKAIQEVQYGGIDAISNPIYKNILQSAMQSSGIYNWADDATRRQAEMNAARGLYGGIGESSIGIYEDKAASKALDYYYDELKAKNQQQRAIELLKAKNEQDLANIIGGQDSVSYLNEKDENGNTRYQNLQTNLQSLIGADGKLKPEYRAKKGQNGNPLSIYKDYQNYLQTHKSYNSTVSSSRGRGEGMGIVAATPTKYEQAMEYIKNKYGVKSVISTEQYNALKALGYEEGGFPMNHGGITNYDMADANTRLNNLATRNKVSIAQGNKINEAMLNTILFNLRRSKSDNALKEIDNRGKIIGNASYDVLDDLTSEQKAQVKIGIDAGNEQIVVFTPKGNYALDPSMLNDTFSGIFTNALESQDPELPGIRYIKNSSASDKEKSDALYAIQRELLRQLMELQGRNIFQVLPETKAN